MLCRGELHTSRSVVSCVVLCSVYMVSYRVVMCNNVVLRCSSSVVHYMVLCCVAYYINCSSSVVCCVV